MSDYFFKKTLFVAPILLGLCACTATSPDKEIAASETNSEISAEINSELADFETQLDAALTAGDSALAAYFAEYVLSAEELLAFVEARYSGTTFAKAEPNLIDTPSENAREIRYTLARRLLREGQWAKARRYFPEDLLPTFNAYVAAIQRGYNAKLSDAERARGFWDAALIVRADGDALFLAAAGPTYVSGGEWEDNPILKLRFSENLASAEERSRVGSRDISRFVNDRRFRAAMLAQNAASLLPNNDERTARILCSAGVWLRYRDPKTADGFYKSVVIRCPQTEIGKHCRELRWFPPTLEWTDEEAWSGPASNGISNTPGASDGNAE